MVSDEYGCVSPSIRIVRVYPSRRCSKTLLYAHAPMFPFQLPLSPVISKSILTRVAVIRPKSTVTEATLRFESWVFGRWVNE